VTLPRDRTRGKTPGPAAGSYRRSGIRNAGRLDDADAAVAYDGWALWVQAGGDNVLFWGQDHLDFAWLATV
jgi:hypothetical protein